MKETFNYGRSDKNSRITVNNNFSDLSIDRSWFSKSLSPVSAGCWERDREGRGLRGPERQVEKDQRG